MFMQRTHETLHSSRFPDECKNDQPPQTIQCGSDTCQTAAVEPVAVEPVVAEQLQPALSGPAT